MKYIKAQGGIYGIIINDKFHLEVTSVDDFWAMTADKNFRAESNINSDSIEKMEVLDDFPFLIIYGDYYLYFRNFVPEGFKNSFVICSEGIMEYSKLEKEFPEILF